MEYQRQNAKYEVLQLHPVWESGIPVPTHFFIAISQMLFSAKHGDHGKGWPVEIASTE